jgi:hypothetical protein
MLAMQKADPVHLFTFAEYGVRMTEPELTPEVVVDEVRRQEKAERDEDVRDEIDQAARLAKTLEDESSADEVKS